VSAALGIPRFNFSSRCSKAFPAADIKQTIPNRLFENDCRASIIDGDVLANGGPGKNLGGGIQIDLLRRGSEKCA
jgi:hypothetical protein